MLDPLTVISLLAPILVAATLYRLLTRRLLPRIDRRHAALARARRPTHAAAATPEVNSVDATRRAA